MPSWRSHAIHRHANLCRFTIQLHLVLDFSEQWIRKLFVDLVCESNIMLVDSLEHVVRVYPISCVLLKQAVQHS